MKRYFIGLVVSKDETAVCLRDDRGYGAYRLCRIGDRSFGELSV